MNDELDGLLGLIDAGPDPHRDDGSDLDRADADRPRHDQVAAALLGSGWTPCGTGDWAHAFRSPSGRLAARVSPFDPACGFAVQLYREGAGNRYLPRLDAHRDLAGGGCLIVMEFLTPLPIEEAAAWHRRRADPQALRADADLAAASALIQRAHRRAEAELPWCGPLDDNPSNVMRDERGQVKFVDLFYLQGLVLYDKVLTAPDEVSAAIPARSRRYMFEIPALTREAGPDEIDRMRAAMSRADAGHTEDSDRSRTVLPVTGLNPLPSEAHHRGEAPCQPGEALLTPAPGSPHPAPGLVIPANAGISAIPPNAFLDPQVESGTTSVR